MPMNTSAVTVREPDLPGSRGAHPMALRHSERPDVLARHVLDVLVRIERASPNLVVAVRQPQLQAPLVRPASREPDVAAAARGAPEVSTAPHEPAARMPRTD